MNETQEEKKQIDIKKIGIIGGICAVVIIALVVFFATKDLRAYNNAKKMLENGSYQEAQQIFEELEDYKDSKDQIYECDYQKASLLIKEEKYSESLEILTSLLEIGYKDSEELYKQSVYTLGKEYFEKKDYNNALKYLEGLNYEDSESLVDSVLNGDYSLNKFIERYNEMVDLLQKTGNATVKKLDAKNVSNNKIITGSGATLYVGTSNYEVVSCVWEIVDTGFTTKSEVRAITGELYCVIAAISPDYTTKSVTNIVNEVLDYSTTTINNICYILVETESGIMLTCDRNLD